MKSVVNNQNDNKYDRNLPCLEPNDRIVMNSSIVDHKDQLRKQIVNRRSSRQFINESEDVDLQIQNLKHHILKSRVDSNGSQKVNKTAGVFYNLNENRDKIQKESD